MTDCAVIGREGYADIPFIEGQNLKSVALSRVTFEKGATSAILCEPKPHIFTQS
jgi:hypothetical protein